MFEVFANHVRISHSFDPTICEEAFRYLVRNYNNPGSIAYQATLVLIDSMDRVADYFPRSLGDLLD